MRLSKANIDIRSIADWRRLAPPVNPDKQWKEGRSAFELARAWVSSTGDAMVPIELVQLFEKTEFATVAFNEVEPEKLVRFDEIRNPRHADLVIKAESSRLGTLAISIEAKADEEFGRRLRTVRAEAAGKPGSRIEERVSSLCAGLFGQANPQPYNNLRYQLLFGAAAAVAHGNSLGASAAFFIVHEFITPLTSDARHNANHANLDQFISRLSNGSIEHLCRGKLEGPISIPGNAYFRAMPLYVGLITRYTR